MNKPGSKSGNGDWRNILADESDPDDELLSETPPDVVAVLGFDPLEFADSKPTSSPPSP